MRTCIVLLFQLSVLTAYAQHTFSIVAVDTVTGEVGGAGATCYPVVNDIADVHPGVGFIHTQSYVDYTNQAYARSLMNRGLLPEEIMDSLQAYDVSGQPQLRQYAAVMLSNGPHSAAFTGTNCYTYYGQRVGRNYAIAGNILKGAMVLDSMESRFLNTPGTLADKLMAALEGAKIVGADKRCINKGVSSLSAYIIVAKPTDIAPNYYLSLNVENVLPKDPIDTLQSLYSNWQLTTALKNSHNNSETTITLFPNPLQEGLLQVKSNAVISEIEIYNSSGTLIMHKQPKQHESKLAVNELHSGIYFIHIKGTNGNSQVRKFIKQ